nr:uncharacterized protein LOC113827126 [Penaeus vannamei]
MIALVYLTLSGFLQVLTQTTDSELNTQPIRKRLNTRHSYNKAKMASTLSRVLPRLVSSLHTTPILSRPRPHKALARTITSFHGLQGLAQPWRVPTEEAPELVERGNWRCTWRPSSAGTTRPSS